MDEESAWGLRLAPEQHFCRQRCSLWLVKAVVKAFAFLITVIRFSRSRNLESTNKYVRCLLLAFWAMSPFNHLFCYLHVVASSPSPLAHTSIDFVPRDSIPHKKHGNPQLFNIPISFFVIKEQHVFVMDFGLFLQSFKMPLLVSREDLVIIESINGTLRYLRRLF